MFQNKRKIIRLTIIFVVLHAVIIHSSSIKAAKDFAKKLNTEFFRYYITANMTHTMTDLDLDIENFKSRINNELIANIGNFVYRTLSFTAKNFDSKISTVRDKMLIENILARAEEVKKSI